MEAVQPPRVITLIFVFVVGPVGICIARLSDVTISIFVADGPV